MKRLSLALLTVIFGLWFAASEAVVMALMTSPGYNGAPTSAASVGIIWVLLFVGWMAYYFAATKAAHDPGAVSYGRRTAGLWPWAVGGALAGLASAGVSWLLTNSTGVPVPDVSAAIPGIVRGAMWVYGMAILGQCGGTVFRRFRLPGWIALAVGLSLGMVLIVLGGVFAPINPLVYLLWLILDVAPGTALVWSIVYWLVLFGLGFGLGWAVDRGRALKA
ncbi:MAG: hypothetical protein WAV45_13915 [Propionibacteriaceae bacterium]|nr:hypothetical protein [Micropruina sp.]HBX80349.1 hypothetical protein [Propionibacteriaceae bacterium]HBY22465.1 hypothetical protein [Propionibacteriaceae bacterium]